MWHLVVLLLLVCVASRFRRDAGGALLPSPTSAPVLRRFWLTTILHPFPVRRIYRTENQLSTRCEDVALSQRKRKKMTINISCAKNVSTAVLDSLARDFDVYFVGLVNSEVGLSAAHSSADNVIYASTNKGLFSAIRQIEPDVHVDDIVSLPVCSALQTQVFLIRSQETVSLHLKSLLLVSAVQANNSEVLHNPDPCFFAA